MMRQGAGNLVRRFSRLAAAAETPAAAPRMPAFDHVPLPYDGPSAAEIARKRAEYLSPSLFHFYSKPVRRSIPPPRRSICGLHAGQFLISAAKKTGSFYGIQEFLDFLMLGLFPFSFS